MDSKSLQFQKLKLEFDYCVKVIWNILWIVTLFLVLVLSLVFMEMISVYLGLLIFFGISLIFSIMSIPIAIKMDRIIKEKIKKL